MNTGGIMEATLGCNLAVDALKQVASLAASDTSKQQLVDACELACGGSCPSEVVQNNSPSAAEQERVY